MDAETWFSMTPEQKLEHARQNLAGGIMTPEIAVSYADAWYRDNPKPITTWHDYGSVR